MKIPATINPNLRGMTALQLSDYLRDMPDPEYWHLSQMLYGISYALGTGRLCPEANQAIQALRGRALLVLANKMGCHCKTIGECSRWLNSKLTS